MFNKFLTIGVPQSWNELALTSLYKNKGLKTDPGNYRGLSVMNVFAKMYTTMLHAKMAKVADEKGLRARA